MRRFMVLAGLSFLFLALPALTQERAATLDGFSPEGARAEQQLEEKFRAIPSPENMRTAMRQLSAHPHHVGSPYDKQNAEWILSQYQKWGWDAHIETFNVLFPTRRSASSNS